MKCIFYQNLISAYLRGGGLEIAVAGNGMEALQLLTQETYDGIISDIEMPGMDGFEFAKEVRKIEKYHNTPLLAISAIEEEALRSQILDSGFDNFKTKANLEVLLETITNLFSVKEVV